MIKLKVFIIKLLYIMCIVRVAMATDTRYTSSHSTYAGSQENKYMTEYRKSHQAYESLLELKANQLNTVRQKLSDITPKYMNGFCDLSRFNEQVSKMHASLVQNRAKFDEAYEAKLLSVDKKEYFRFHVACERLDAANVSNTVSNQNYYSRLLEDHLNSIGTVFRELQALAIEIPDDEVENHIHGQLIKSMNGLPIQTLYKARYPIITRIMALLTDAHIQSWDRLSHEIQKIVQNMLGHDASLIVFLSSLKNETFYNPQTTLRQFLEDLSSNIHTLLGPALKDTYSEVGYLADVLDLSATDKPKKTELGEKLNITMSLINLVALHGVLCKDFAYTEGYNINAILATNLNQIIHSTSINQLDIIKVALEMVTGPENQIEGRFNTFMDMAKKKQLCTPTVSLAALKHSLQIIRESNKNAFANVLANVQKILRFYNSITTNRIHIVELTGIYPFPNTAIIMLILGNPSSPCDKILVEDVANLSNNTATIHILPNMFNLDSQIVGLYKLLKPLNPDREITINLTQILQNSLANEDYHVKIETLKAYIRSYIRDPNLIIIDPDFPFHLQGPVANQPNATSSNPSVVFDFGGALFSIAAIVASIFANGPAVFIILPPFLASLSALKAVLSVALFELNNRAFRITYYVIACALCVLLMLYTGSLAFVVHNQVQSVLLQVPVLYALFNLLALAMVIMSVFGVPFKFMSMNESAQTRINKYLGFAAYTVSLALSLTALVLQMVSGASTIVNAGYGLIFLSAVFLFSGAMQDLIPPKPASIEDEEQRLYALKAHQSRILHISALLGVVGIVWVIVIYSTVLSYQSGMFANSTPYTQLPNLIASNARDLLT